MEEKLLTGIMSSNMWRKGDPYYGLFLTTERIIGVPGFIGVNAGGEWTSNMESSLFDMKDASGSLNTRLISEDILEKIDASMAISALDERKDFEAAKHEVEELRIEKNKKSGLTGFFSTLWGKAVIKTPQKKAELKLSENVTDREIRILTSMFAEFKNDKLAVSI